VGGGPGGGPGDPTYERLFTVVRGGFAHRRKMLRRSLEGVVRPEAFEATGIRATARAEELGLVEWERLAAWQPGDRSHPAFRTGS
jgi:16S rRNA A1518/A1519 N6-dimethyltransferase RsmA/KsgA/DIM1 with predicted DNA glycosylase/AP lyase activity